MTHIAKAYIKLQDGDNSSIVTQLEDIGYMHIADRPERILFISNGKIDETRDVSILNGFIDCNAYTPNGTEEEAVRLFLILAEMNDDEPSTLWYKAKVITDAYLNRITTQRVLVRGLPTGSQYLTCFEDWTGIATPLEVAEAFKEGRIK